jgi:hypothetical protein
VRPYHKKKKKKWAGRVAQGEDPKFKSQYCKKQKNGGRWERQYERVVEGVNLIKVHYMLYGNITIKSLCIINIC